MPYVFDDVFRGERRSSTTVPASFGEVMNETFAAAYEENPILATRRYLALNEDQRTGPRLLADTARARLKNAGMDDIQVSEAGITEAALLTLMDRKRIERRRQEVFASSEGGAGEVAARLGLAMATSLVDPIGMGLNFVPVVGQARYARWLAGARGLAGRLGVRAQAGLIEGVAGSAIAEVPVYAMRTQEQADYDMGNSLLNVAFGGVVGAGLHTTVGTADELISGAPEMSVPRNRDLSDYESVVEQRLARKVARGTDSAVREYEKIDGIAGSSEGGKVLNTDLARELSPEYRADRTQSNAVHEPASWLVKRMYERRLAEVPKEGEEPLVLFSAGGTGAGKSTGLNDLLPAEKARSQIIYDTNMNSLKSSADKIEKALAAGKRVSIVYTWRDPVDALVNGALPRAKRMGRTVPLDEHAATHVGAAATIKELAANYAGDERVGFVIIDNSRGKGGARVSGLEVVRELEYNSVREDLISALEAERAAGRVSDAVYRGTRGPQGSNARARRGYRQEPEQGGPGGQVTAAEVVDSAPSEVQQAAMRAAVGQAVEGAPINVTPILGANERPLDLELSADHQNATRAADETLDRDVEPTIEANLTAANDELALAEADAKSLAERLGVKYGDAEMAAVDEAAAQAERWAKAAELATVCLVRGG